MEMRDVHPYVLHCRTYLENASGDPLLSGHHLRDLIDYLSTSPAQPSSNVPFAWSYMRSNHGKLQLSKLSSVKDFEQAGLPAERRGVPALLFLAGYPSPAWLNAIGYKYEVDSHFFQRHMSFQPSAQLSLYAEPSLPSNSRHILRLIIPTIGVIDPTVQNPSESLPLTRQRCLLSQKQTFRERRQRPVAGSAIIRRLHIHNWERFTLEQKLSICLLRKGKDWIVLIWTDAGGEDCDPKLPLSDLPAFRSWNYDFKFRPTILDRQDWQDQSSTSSNEQSAATFKTTQKLNLLHRVYGTTLSSDLVQRHPFYALNEMYAFAAAAENQFLNMIEQLLADRIASVTLMHDEDIWLKTSDLQYDRNILDAHHDRIKDIATFLAAQDDPTWFQPFQNEISTASIEARLTLVRDYQYLETRVTHLILRIERTMEMIASNAALAESKRSNLQSEGLAKLTRMTTLVTILYVPLSFICSFFGMNFSIFGQGHLGLWIWGAVSAPILVLSLILLRTQMSF